MFKERLANIMEIKGMSDEQLSLSTGLSRTAIWNYKTKKGSQPSLSNAKKIADCLRVSLDYLAGGELEIASIRTKRKDVANLLHHLNDLAEEDIYFLTKMILPYAQKTQEAQERRLRRKNNSIGIGEQKDQLR